MRTYWLMAVGVVAASAYAVNARLTDNPLPAPAAAASVASDGLPRPAASVAADAPQSPAQSGERLFVQYNCADCHGAGGSGAMGPSFVDGRWRYGGTSSEIFRSIAEGRPDGMPAWGSIIPGPEMVALAAYVRSLDEGKDLTTENFTGATVERTGH